MFKCWFFRFEGEFTRDARIYAGDGVFSMCLVPEAEYVLAEELFLNALISRSIVLIEIQETFPLSKDSMDFDEPKNKFWVKWIQETCLLGTVNFEKLHLFPK